MGGTWIFDDSPARLRSGEGGTEATITRKGGGRARRLRRSARGTRGQRGDRGEGKGIAYGRNGLRYCQNFVGEVLSVVLVGG